MGGGVKTFRSEGSKQWGSRLRSYHCRSSGSAVDVEFLVSDSNPGFEGLLAAAEAPYLRDRGSNRRPKRIRSAALPFGHCLI